MGKKSVREAQPARERKNYSQLAIPPLLRSQIYEATQGRKSAEEFSNGEYRQDGELLLEKGRNERK